MGEEGMKATSNKLIYIGKLIPFDIRKFSEQLPYLAESDLKIHHETFKNIYIEAATADKSC